MKKTILVLLFIFIRVNFLFPQIGIAPVDTVKSYPGIPLITYQGSLGMEYFNPNQFIDLKNSGMFSVVSTNLKREDYLNKIKPSGVLVMPEQAAPPNNGIWRYTEAVYTVWEAEGTPQGEGLVTLYNDKLPRNIIDGAVVTTDTTPKGTLIYGPMYRQEVHYAKIGSDVPIEYEAAYKLKLDTIGINHSPDDTICILQVTTTRTWDDSLYWGWYENLYNKKISPNQCRF
jgi:hypothetical protein